MEFENDGESVLLPAADKVSHIAELTSTEPESVSKTLLFRTVATGGGEVIEKGHSQQEACFGRDAFAKVTLEGAACPSCCPQTTYTNGVMFTTVKGLADYDANSPTKPPLNDLRWTQTGGH